MNEPRAVVWDLPTRLFHWLLVLLVIAQYGSGKFAWFDMQWHFYAGYATLTLLLFRFVWGLIGSESARFASFVRGPGAVIRYLRAWRDGTMKPARSHNPLGGWSALIMLVLLLAIVATGLATSDDIDWFGPLTSKFDHATIAFATRWHHWLGDILPWLIAIHVIGVILHERRGERLIAAMWHGRRVLAGAPLRQVTPWLALAATMLCAAVVYALLIWAGS